MKTICVAFFTLCLFTVANAQYASNVSLQTPTEVETVTEPEDLHQKIARRNAQIQVQNKQAQQVLIQHLSEHTQYPEALRATLPEGRVTVAIQLDRSGKVEHYSIVQSPDPAFNLEVDRVMKQAPSVVGSGQAYLGARKLIIPIDFSLR